MAFGQQAGPPASARQVQELLSLLHDAGHTGFRDARGPLGFTQRQGGGRFTRQEAEVFIDRLRNEAEEGGGFETAAPVATTARLSVTDRSLQRVPTDRLAAELRRRGCTVTEP